MKKTVAVMALLTVMLGASRVEGAYPWTPFLRWQGINCGQGYHAYKKHGFHRSMTYQGHGASTHFEVPAIRHPHSRDSNFTRPYQPTPRWNGDRQPADRTPRYQAPATPYEPIEPPSRESELTEPVSPSIVPLPPQSQSILLPRSTALPRTPMYGETSSPYPVETYRSFR